MQDASFVENDEIFSLLSVGESMLWSIHFTLQIMTDASNLDEIIYDTDVAIDRILCTWGKDITVKDL